VTAKRPTLGYLIGSIAALSFGVSAPVSKRLLDDIGPQLLAGILYAGAFALMLIAVVARRSDTREARLQRADAPRLAGLVVFGGIVAPVLLLFGLQRVTGVVGSLLLNLEGPFTVVIGVLIFREHLGRRTAIGAIVLFVGGAIVSAPFGSAGTVDVLGVLLIVGACVCWGIDNNLTQSLSLRDPYRLVLVKAGVAAATNVTIAAARGESVEGAGVVLIALAVGAVSYGISVLLDAYALRMLGAVREAAIFATAPFAGAVVAIPLLDESLSWLQVLAMVGMAAGVLALIFEDHAHRHEHETPTHEHRHVHDEHHQHEHCSGAALPPAPTRTAGSLTRAHQ